MAGATLAVEVPDGASSGLAVGVALLVLADSTQPTIHLYLMWSA